MDIPVLFYNHMINRVRQSGKMSENHVFFQARDKNVTSVGLLATLDPSVNTSDQ
jgi:hypothetical protein